MFPKMVRIRQVLPAQSISDPSADAREKIEGYAESHKLGTLKSKKIGITAGSRGISSISSILKAVVDFVKNREGIPFLIPAMGSHGGATADEQIDILVSLGITEESVGAPIVRSIETVKIGDTSGGAPVFINRAALEMDGLFVVNRVKPHTDFSGKIESGICKMCAIGLGAYEGALATHSCALTHGYENTIMEAAGAIMKKWPLVVAVAILENWKGETAGIEVVPESSIFDREPELRYVSDGNPDTVTVPEAFKHKINEDALEGRELIIIP